MTITDVSAAAFASASAARSSAIVVARIARAPRLRAFATKSIGRSDDVPKPFVPSERDSAPIEANPWLSTSTTMSFAPSPTAVVSSPGDMRYEPSPSRTNTSRSGAARRAPMPPGISYPMHE